MSSTRLFRLLPAALPLLVAAGCASIGNPSGGARDEEPPQFVRSNPAPGSTGVDRRRIDIEFDELVNVKDAFTNVVVSPLSAQTPRVSSQGRRVTVQFTDSLLPNTTYTVDFGNAIEDNNEGNKLQGFTYSFSTGPVLDTLSVSGMVLGARDLEPQQGILVGVHSNLNDTAFTRTRFERLARTDDRGRFTVRGLAPGTYRVFALEDADGDYKYANPEEGAAFLDFTVTPTAERFETTDTIRNLLTGAVDTVVGRMRTRFLPNDLLLRTFVSDRRPQYLVKHERPDSARVSLIFNAMSATPPTVTPVSPLPQDSSWGVLERSAHNDTLTWWLTSPRLIEADTLRLAVAYMRDTAAVSDTIRLITPRERTPKKKQKKISEADSLKEVLRRITLPLTITPGSTQEIYQPLSLEFGAPLVTLDTAAFHLEQRADTLWTPVARTWQLQRRNTISPRAFTIGYDWDFDTSYRLVVDSLAARDLYGRVAMPQTHEFKTRAESDYSALTLRITGFTDSVPAFVELLNTSDNPVRAVQLQGDGNAVFRYLQPGKYYARIYTDANGNGLYDTGDYAAGRQPDVAYYYPKLINLKKNWDKTETWDVFGTAVDLQKPSAIKKNKPEADKRRSNASKRQDDEEEEDDNPFGPVWTPNDDPNRRY